MSITYSNCAMKSKKQFILLFYLIMAKTNTLRDLLFVVNHERNEWKIKRKTEKQKKKCRRRNEEQKRACK